MADNRSDAIAGQETKALAARIRRQRHEIARLRRQLAAVKTPLVCRCGLCTIVARLTHHMMTDHGR